MPFINLRNFQSKEEPICHTNHFSRQQIHAEKKLTAKSGFDLNDLTKLSESAPSKTLVTSPMNTANIFINIYAHTTSMPHLCLV